MKARFAILPAGFPRLFSAVASAAVLAVLLSPLAARAQNSCTVNATTDTGAGSGNTGDIAYCITQANASTSNFTVNFDPSVFGTPRTITISSTLEVSNTKAAVTIQGPGANLLTFSASARINPPVLTFDSDTNVAISGLTITNGNANDGGAINSQATTLTVTGVTFTGNTAEGEGGAIYSDGTLMVTNSTFSKNLAGYGGAILNAGTLTVTNSTFSANSANEGGAIYSDGALMVTNSTFSGSSAYRGGAIYNDRTLTLANNIFTANTVVVNGGAIYNDGATVIDNGYNDFDSSNGDSVLEFSLSSTDQTGPANLSALASYGGPTQTMLPQPGSAAICAGSTANVPSGVTTDQRGYPRTNTIYTGFNSTTPCVDVGAVQTNYQSVQFTNVPTDGDYTGLAGATVSPAPIVSVTENNRNTGGIPLTLGFRGTGTATGLGPVTTVAGTGAAFGSLSVNQTGDDALSIDLDVTSSGSVFLSASANLDILGQAPAITSPTPGSALTGASQLFQWSLGNQGVTQTSLQVGTTGVGSSDIFNGSLGTATSAQVTGIPEAGATLYTRLNYQLGSSLDSIDYQYTEAPVPVLPSLTSPTSGSSLTGASQLFQWSLGNQGVTQTSLQVGTTGVGSWNIFNGALGTAISAQVTGIPETGGTLYVRLNYQVGASLDSIDYQYTEAPAPTILINFANGFAGATIDLNGSAKISSSALSLITGCCQQSTAYYPTPVAISSFTTTFTFLFTSADADGMTFVVQNQGPTAQGAGGGGLGYGTWGPPGITPSAAVKFDLYNNSGEGIDSTGFYTDGAPPTVPAVDMSSSPINLHGGHPMQVQLTYDGQNLTETITDTVTQGQFTHTYSNVNLPEILGASTAYAGFTASSGALGSVQSVLSWTYTAAPPTQSAPSITSASSATFSVGTPGAFAVTTTGNPTPSLSETGALPSGVTFTDNGNGTATLAGTPASGTTGAYPLTILASNGISPNATQSFTLTVGAAPSITSASTATFSAGVSGSFTVTTSGFPAPALSETGALPSGVTFTNNGNGTATLTGTPAAGTSGAYPLTIAASNGISPSGSQSFTLKVQGAPSITSGSATTFTQGVAGSFMVTTTGYPSSSLSETGALPSGVTFTDNGNGTATLAGTPASGTSGTYPLIITASNGISPNATQSFTLTVAAAPPVLINFANGFTGATLDLNGSAKIISGALQLTTVNLGGASAYYPTPVSISSFSTTFTFQFTDAVADGMTFVVQNQGPTALGSGGGGLCYGRWLGGPGITPSAAVKFDLYNNSGEGSDSTGFYTDGAAPTVPAVDMSNSPINLHNGDILQVQLTYDGQTLTETITDTVTQGQFTHTYSNINLPQILGANTAYVGFTAANGALTSNTNVLSWTYYAEGPLPALTSPAPGSTLTGSSQLFQWSLGNQGVTQTSLQVGTTGVGSSDIFNGSLGSATSAQVTGIPETGAKLYVRLNYQLGASLDSIDYLYTEAAPILPAITSPAAGSTLTGGSQLFQWSLGNQGVTQTSLQVGTTGVGSSNIFNGALGTATSAQITNIPIAGATLYVRLNYQLGASLDSIDYQYTEAPAPTPPVLTTPPPSSTLSGPGATFIWTHGSNITEYQFTLGTTGPGSSDVYNGSPTTTTSAAVTNIPTNGAVLYARLSYLAYGSWSPIDYQYTEAPAPIQPALATPTPGSTLSGSSATFTWNPGTGSTSFRLQVGTLGTGSSDIYNGTATTTTSVTLHNLPVNGAQLYVRLNYLMNSVWSSIDYMLTEASPVLPSLTTPAPGSTLTGSSAPFSWNPGNVATFFELQVGTAPDMHDVYNGGPTKTTSVSARNIPANGVTLYATLYYELNHDWHAIDYQYTESGTPTLPFMTSPAPHSTLTGSAATFSWDPGAGATRFELLVGTGPGLGDIYRGGPTTATSVQVSNVPTKGKKIFAELYYELSGKWHDILYTFTEAP